MAGLFDILNVSPAERVQPTMPTGLQGIAQTLSGVANRGVQQAAGQDTRTVEAKIKGAMSGGDASTPAGLIAIAQRLDAIGEGPRAAQVRQLAATKQRENVLLEREQEAIRRRESETAFIANKWPELSNVSDVMTIAQAQAYDTAEKAGETSQFLLDQVAYYKRLGEPDLAAAAAAGESLTSIAREANDRAQVPQPTQNQFDQAKAVIESTEVGRTRSFFKAKAFEGHSSDEIDALANRLWYISQRQNIDLTAASEVLALELGPVEDEVGVVQPPDTGTPGTSSTRRQVMSEFEYN